MDTYLDTKLKRPDIPNKKIKLSEYLKKICNWQDLEEKGLLSPENQALLDQARKELSEVFDLFRGNMDMIPAGTVSTHSGKDSPTFLIMSLAKQPQFIYALRNLTREYLTRGNRGQQKVYCIDNKEEAERPNVDIGENTKLVSDDLGDIPEEFLWDEISEVIYDGKTLGEIISDLRNVPSRTWDKLRKFSKDYNVTSSAEIQLELDDESLALNLLDEQEYLNYQKAISASSIEDIEDAIEKLPPKQRQAIELKRQRCRNVEIAAILKISDSRVSQLLNAARRNIENTRSKPASKA